MILGCGCICQAPQHHTLCYNLLPSLLARLFIHVFNSWYWDVDSFVKHYTTTHYAITCCLLCSLVYSYMYFINDLFMSFLLGLLSCGFICQAPHHHTLCYNLLLSLLARLFIYVFNWWYWAVDSFVKHYTTTHYAITCCLLCSLVYSYAFY